MNVEFNATDTFVVCMEKAANYFYLNFQPLTKQFHPLTRVFEPFLEEFEFESSEQN